MNYNKEAKRLTFRRGSEVSPGKSLLGEGALRGAVQQIKVLGRKKALIPEP